MPDDIVKIKPIITSNPTTVYSEISDSYQVDHTGSFSASDVLPEIKRKRD